MAQAQQGGLSGVDKAAILLMSLGEEMAAEILRHLGPRDVQRVGVAMAALESVPRERVRNTATEFIDQMQELTSIGVNSDDYIKNMLTGALGEDKANSMIERILIGGNAKGLESLKWMDARGVFELIRLEHPQIIAIVLSYLEYDQSAQILAEFPENMRTDILLRIATLDGVQPSALQELNEILESQLKGGSGARSSALGGVKCAAEILNFADRAVEGRILEEITNVDAELAENIQDLMFTFENLVDIDDRGIQTLLRDISTDNLTVALKGTDDAVRQKVFANMSERAADMLKDDLETKGPVRLSDVEAAQKEIIAVARRLADEGQISLGSGGGEEMV